MNPLHSRLAALRRRLRFVVTLRGVCLIGAVLLAGLLAGGLFDFLVYRFVGLETFGLFRAAILVGTLTWCGLISYLLLLRPLAKRTDDLSLALRVEEQYPVLNDALASTVQFLQQSGEPATGTSPSLQREAVQRALRLAQGCDFGKAVNARGLSLSVGALLVLLLIAVPLLLLQPTLAWTAFTRLADPFGDHPWHRVAAETQLTVHYPQFLAIGQPLTVTGEVRGVIPDKATITFEDNDMSAREVEIKDGKFLAGGIKAPSHRREIRFRVRANDAVSPPQTGAWHVVVLRQAPQLVALNGKPSPQITLRQPKYTQLPEVLNLPEGTGNLDVVAGTHVTLRAATDLPIAKAWIEYKPLQAGTREALPLAPLGMRGGVEGVTATGLAHSGWGHVAGVIEKNGQVFTIKFLPWLTGAYVLTIEDKDGLSKSYDYDLHVMQDPPPVVSLLRPSTSQSVLANAELTLQILAEDEVFGLRSVYLEYRRKDKHGTWIDPAPKRLLFFDHDKARNGLPLFLNVLAASPVPLPALSLDLRPKRLLITQRWSLKGLAIEGETVVIQACADDFNDVLAFPQPGKSHEIELKVVGKQALAAVIDEQEAQIQQQLLKIKDMQDKAIKKLIGVEEQLKANGKLRPEDLVELAEVEQLQKEIQARIGAKKDEGLRAELAQFEQMLKDNKLPKSEVGERIKAVREELDRINREHLPKIEADLDKARQDLETLPKEQPPEQKTPGDLGKALNEQEKVHQALQDLLKYMEDHSTLQQVKAELRAILQEQRDRLEEVLQFKEKIKEANGDVAVLKKAQLKAELRRTAELQRRLPKRAEKLLDDLEAMAAKMAGTDPGLHEMLLRVLDIAKPKNPPGLKAPINDAVPDIMRNAAEYLKDEFDILPSPKFKNKPPRMPNVHGASLDMGDAVDRLEKMLAALDQSRADELQHLVINQKKADKNLDELGKRMDALQKQIDAAMKLPDPEARDKALKKLAKDLRELQKEAEQKAGELARLQAKDAAKDLDAAAKKLQRVVEELERGEDPKEALKQAQQNVDNAKEKLQDAREAAEEELGREKIAKIVDRLKGLKERQDAAIVESERLLKSVLQNKYWPRGVYVSLFDLRDRQEELAKDTALVRDKLTGAKVYHAILNRAMQDMNNAHAKIIGHTEKSRVRQEPHQCDELELADEKKLTEGTIKLQQDASNRLQRLIDALLPELEPQPQPDPKQAKEKDGGGVAPGGKEQPKGIQAQDGIPGVAQLKALKAEQVDVNARTKEFAERHPDFDRLTPAEQAELDAIRAEQERLLELFREMITAANAEGGKKQ